MQQHLIPKGIFHASADYTNDARAYARENRIQLVSGKELVANILRLPEPVQKALLDLTTSGDYTTPMCPASAKNGDVHVGSRRFLGLLRAIRSARRRSRPLHTSW